MRRVLFAVLLAVPVGARAQDVSAKLASKIANPELREMTERVLREMNVDYGAMADQGLAAKGEKFDHLRLEVTGVMSHDDTNRVAPGVFDKFAKPSFSAKEKKGVGGIIGDVIRRGLDPAGVGTSGEDISDFAKAARGEMTPRTRDILSPYKGKEINEIVAHSWGCEVVYAAILNGELRPPKKLIIVGVPDDDLEKWRLLASRTGTEVHWVRAPNDAVAIDAGAKLSKYSSKKVDFAAQWDARCSGPKKETFCNAHNRPAAAFVQETIGRIPGLTGHDRAEYYALLSGTVLKGKISDLQGAGKAVKAAEVLKVQKAALETAQLAAKDLVVLAREQVKIAQLDHDERLMDAYLALAKRCCETPGSVSQSEFDALPQPYNAQFYLTRIPHTLGDCILNVFGKIGGSFVPVADEIEQLAATYAPATPVAVQGRPVPVKVEAMPPSPFESAIPLLRGFAVAACISPQTAYPAYLNLDEAFYKSLSGRRAEIERLIEYHAMGLSGCARRFYGDLVAMVLNGTYAKVGEPNWIANTVASYSPQPSQTPRYVPPPPPSGGGGETVSPPPPEVVHDPDGEALEQLREIERRKRWGLPPRR